MVALRAGARITPVGYSKPQCDDTDSPLRGSWDSAFSLVRLGLSEPS